MSAENIVERLEAIASREDQVFGAMSNALEIREAAAEIVRLRGELAVANECLGEERAANVLRTPAPAMPNGVEYDWKCIISVLEHGMRDGIHGGYNASYIKQQIKALRAADNRDAAGVDPEEDAYVIERMGKLLAEIAVIVNGPEPDMTRWIYHDLPDKVRALKTAPAAVPAGEAVARGGECSFNCMATMSCDNSCKPTPQPADGGAVALWISRHWREDLGRDSVVSVVNREDPAHTLRIYVSTTPPAPVQAAPQEGGVYQPVRFGGIRRPSDEALAAAFWEHRQRENSLPADLCDSKLVKFGNDIVQRARELAPYLAANPSACELGAVCMWDYDEDTDAWNGTCGSMWQFTAGDPDDNDMHYCPKCGKRCALQHRGDSRGGEGS